MVERQKAMEAFKHYVAPYDVTNEKIALKIAHTYRTAQMAEEIAKSIDLDEENVDLAWLIGLLHDIGRFEQLRIYDTFNDSQSIDHGDFGVKILFQDGLIRDFIEKTQYDDIIYEAVKNHNKYKIAEGLTEEELVHAKIIRDADKTDIFKIHVEDLENNKCVLYDMDELKKQKITPKILDQFLEHQSINGKNMQNELDHFILIISFIYDYNYTRGLEIIKEKQYIERIIKVPESYGVAEEQIALVKEVALNFLNEHIK